MPLLNFHLLKGRTERELKELLDTAHDAMVAAFGVPESDRYQTVKQYSPGELVILDTGLGYNRTEKVVLLTIVSRPRTKEQKQNFYKYLAQQIEMKCGISPNDLMISLVENSDADWSFGHGNAEFLTGDL